MNATAENNIRLDEDSLETYFDKIAVTLERGAVTMMISYGHRLGLLDAMADCPPSTSSAVAQATGLSERYVREWLAVMVTGGLVEYDSLAETYFMPPECAYWLSSRYSTENLAVYAQSVAMAGALQEDLLQCFKTGNGLSYACYPNFHDVMAEDSQQTVVENLPTIIDSLAPDLVERLQNGIDVLDAGCGAGRALLAVAEQYPNSTFTGFDLCPDAIERANESARQRGFGNVLFDVRDMSRVETLGAFDLITSFDAVHDLPDPQSLLQTIRHSLNSGGVHLMQDIGGSAHLENNIDFPFAPLLYMISTIHCTPVSLAQGGQGLGTMWGWETAQSMLANAGFVCSERVILPHDPMNVWFVSRVPEA